MHPPKFGAFERISKTSADALRSGAAGVHSVARGMRGACVHLALWSFLLFGSGCLGDAEHSNPLDPLSDAYVDAGGVTGLAVNRKFEGVAGVAVRLQPIVGDTTAATLRMTETNAGGIFRFDLVPTGAYRLRFDQHGYASATVDVTVSAGSLAQAGEVQLNALPIVVASALRTVHVSRWWPEDDLYMLDVEVLVVDPDERPGIDSTRLEFPGLQERIVLQRGVAPGVFVRQLPADSLGSHSVHQLVGAGARLRIVDREGSPVIYDVQPIIRVIEQTPVAVRPEGLEAVDDPQPILEWVPMELPFGFTYRIEVVRDGVNTDVLVQRHDGISSQESSFLLPIALSSGAYYWTVAVVDAVGNVSRSREAGFLVN